MRRVDDVEQLLATPDGTYVAGDGFLIWSHSATLGGSALSTDLTADSWAIVMRMWELTQKFRALRFSIVTDLLRVTPAPPPFFASLMAFGASEANRMSEHLARHALVVAPNLAGATAVGILPLSGSRHDWRAFHDGREAFAWSVENTDEAAHADAIHQTVDALVVTHFESAHIRFELRRVLRELMPSPTLARAARALGRAPRSLQRELATNRITFRELLEEVRLQRARELLAETDDKLEAIAEALGYRSLSSFGRLFRATHGVAPSEWRQQHAGRRTK